MRSAPQPSPNGRSSHQQLSRWCTAICAVPAFLLFLLVLVGARDLRLTFDETFNITVAKNLALKGVYGTSTYNGTVALDPAISTGPTVLVPIAAVIKVAGPGVWQSRIVAVLYFALFIVAVGIILRRCHSPGLAMILAFSALAPFRVYEEASRVLGEFPAFAMVAAAAVILQWSLSEGSRWRPLVAGGVLAIAVLAKPLAFPVYLSALAAVGIHGATGGAGLRQSTLRAGALLIVPAVIPAVLWMVAPRLLHPEYFHIRASLMSQQVVYAGRLTPLDQLWGRVLALPSPGLFLVMTVASAVVLWSAWRFRRTWEVFLSLSFFGYLCWWLFLAPSADRRLALYWVWIGAVMIGLAVSAAWARLEASVAWTPARRAGGALGLVLVVVLIGWVLVGTAGQYKEIAGRRGMLQEQLRLVRFATWAAGEAGASPARVYGYQWYMPWVIPALSTVEIGEFERDWLLAAESHSAYLVEVPEMRGDAFVRSLVRRAMAQYGSESSEFGPYVVHRLLSGRWTDRLLTCDLQQDLLSVLSSADVLALPTRLEDRRGRFRFPLALGWNVGWEKGLGIRPIRPAVAMITEAELLFRGVEWRPNTRLLLGVLIPPELSDGFTLRASLLLPGAPSLEVGRVVVARGLYRSGSPFFYSLFPSFPEYTGRAVLKIALLPEPGGGGADWAFLSPLAFVRAPGVGRAEDCLRR